MKSKICGISDIKTLKYLTNHPFPPEYIGFIVNYKKSKRYHFKNLMNDSLYNEITIVIVLYVSGKYGSIYWYYSCNLSWYTWRDK